MIPSFNGNKITIWHTMESGQHLGILHRSAASRTIEYMSDLSDFFPIADCTIDQEARFLG